MFSLDRRDVKYVGYMSIGPEKFDWFAQSVRKHVDAAGLL